MDNNQYSYCSSLVEILRECMSMAYYPATITSSVDIPIKYRDGYVLILFTNQTCITYYSKRDTIEYKLLVSDYSFYWNEDHQRYYISFKPCLRSV